jgi:pyruvate/2-oxoglutarate dehydrogenase complex dihydrolipoamide acyltransferase (E2) component
VIRKIFSPWASSLDQVLVMWLKSPGDLVDAGETIALVENKGENSIRSCTVDCPCILRACLVPAETLIPTNLAIAIVDTIKTIPEQMEIEQVSTLEAGWRIVGRVPGFGEAVSEVGIGKWNFRVGDWIEPTDELTILQGDKADMYLHGSDIFGADHAGILVEIFAEDVSDVAVGSRLATLLVGVPKPETPPAPPASRSIPDNTPIDVEHDVPRTPGTQVCIFVPNCESRNQWELLSWHRQAGELCPPETLLAVVESDMAVVDLVSPPEHSLLVEKLFVEGAVVAGGSLLARMEIVEAPSDTSEE